MSATPDDAKKKLEKDARDRAAEQEALYMQRFYILRDVESPNEAQEDELRALSVKCLPKITTF